MDVEEPRRAGRGGAGAAHLPGASQRARPDRTRDARRSGPPHLHRNSMHAECARPSGPTSTPEQMRASATIIQDTAHRALDDLRATRRPPRSRVRRAAGAAAADVPRPRHPGRDRPLGRAQGDLRRPARRRPRAARRDRPHRLPDRAGGDDERRTARAGHGAADHGERVARAGRQRRAAQPARRSVRSRPPAPGSGWSGSANAPSCGAAGSRDGARTARGCCAAGSRGPRKHVDRADPVLVDDDPLVRSALGLDAGRTGRPSGSVGEASRTARAAPRRAARARVPTSS